MPIPYHRFGSEGPGDKLLTIDPDNPHCNVTYQLSMVSGLPMMAHKATRSVAAQAQVLYSFFSPTGPQLELLARLDQRLVLAGVSELGVLQRPQPVLLRATARTTGHAGRI